MINRLAFPVETLIVQLKKEHFQLGRIECAENPFGAKVFIMCPVSTLIYPSRMDHSFRPKEVKCLAALSNN
jgi:hypothetical protein